jgi:hypothetical protein
VAGHPWEVGQLGDAVNQFGNFVAKLAAQIIQRYAGVFDGVVQKAGGDDGRGQVHLAEHFGDGKAMIDVRLAGGASLPGVGALGQVVGAVNEQAILRAEGWGKEIAKFVEFHCPKV